MMDFGLVTEGVTDQEVLSNILFGYYNNPNILISELQPLRDETDKIFRGEYLLLFLGYQGMLYTNL